MVPPFPAASRPSKMTMTRSPFALTQSCNMHSSACSLISSFAYSFPESFSLPLSFSCLLSFSSPLSFDMSSPSSRLLLPTATERPIELGARAHLGAACLREPQLLLEAILIGCQDLDVARKPGIVPGAREIGRVQQDGHSGLVLLTLLGQL